MTKPSKHSLKFEVQFLEIEEVLAIHDRMLEIGGGREGILNFSTLLSAIGRPQATFMGKSLYPDISAQAGALIQSLIRNHPFSDANKRTGFFSTLRFLNKNGYDLKASEKEIIDFTLSIDVDRISLEEISSWIQKHSKKRM